MVRRCDSAKVQSRRSSGCSSSRDAAHAQTPTVINGRLGTRALAGPLDRELMRSSLERPIRCGCGYWVATTSRGDDDGGCWSNGDGGRRAPRRP